MSDPKKLSPAANPAAYPTLEQARRRRMLLAGIGAASLGVGVGCLNPSGEPAPPSLDASGVTVQDAATFEPDAGSEEGGDR